jgi:hypothetical protein
LCDTIDLYVERAVSMACDRPGLAQRRATQRERMLASALMDEPAFCEKFGQALRMLWAHWCQQQSFAPTTSLPELDADRSPPEDGLLVPVNGSRVTLRDARFWLAALRERLKAAREPSDLASARALALAILWVRPSDPLAAELVHETADWMPSGMSDPLRGDDVLVVDSEGDA